MLSISAEGRRILPMFQFEKKSTSASFTPQQRIVNDSGRFSSLSTQHPIATQRTRQARRKK